MEPEILLNETRQMQSEKANNPFSPVSPFLSCQKNSTRARSVTALFII
jgi:hypothetical protein